MSPPTVISTLNLNNPRKKELEAVENSGGQRIIEREFPHDIIWFSKSCLAQIIVLHMSSKLKVKLYLCVTEIVCPYAQMTYLYLVFYSVKPYIFS